jgi:hypothetical protein
MLDIEVWTIPDCCLCEQAKAYLVSNNLPFTERSLLELRRGEINDSDALVELALNDGDAPLIRVNGHFITLLVLPTLLQEGSDDNA